MRPGHFWICKFGTLPGSMRYDGDRSLVVELLLHRVTDDLSGTADFHITEVKPLQLLDGKTGLVTGLIAGKQGWKCPVVLLTTCCGTKQTSFSTNL